MVGKLLKHDLLSLFRLLLYFGCIALGSAILSRILMFVDDNVFSVLLLVVAIWAAIAMVGIAFIGSITRFYKSLFTGEGYMTFSLPVSVTKLVISKLLSAFIASLAGIAVCVVCAFILLSGLPAEEFQYAMTLIGNIFNGLGVILSYDPLITIELILMVILALPMGLLQYYVCLSLGQMFNKHRVGWTFGIIIVASTVLSMLNGYCLMPIIEAASTVSPHLSSWIYIIVFAGLDVGYFFLVRYLLSHKLNLLV